MHAGNLWTLKPQWNRAMAAAASNKVDAMITSSQRFQHTYPRSRTAPHLVKGDSPLPLGPSLSSCHKAQLTCFCTSFCPHLQPNKKGLKSPSAQMPTCGHPTRGAKVCLLLCFLEMEAKCFKFPELDYDLRMITNIEILLKKKKDLYLKQNYKNSNDWNTFEKVT